MRKHRALAGASVLAAVTAIAGTAVVSSTNQQARGAQQPAASTAKVERGRLSDTIFQYGTLTYRARPDGSPYSVINHARGTYTRLPAAGARVDCGDVLYRVDDRPVLLLCGVVPAYRELHRGDVGKDVRQLNRNLHELGYDTDAGVHVNPHANDFTGRTRKALEALQHHRGFRVTGALALGDAVFLPESVRIADVTGQPGASAGPGAQVLSATSERLEVQINLDASQQGEVRKGDRARITLPGNRSATGQVVRLGRVAQASGGRNGDATDATIPASIRLDDPGKARGLDRAPVQVGITTAGVANALSVPVTAIVGRSGGGFAVEVVRAGGRRDLVSVQLGLFDTAGGRVQVEGDLRKGDRVVVPSE